VMPRNGGSQNAMRWTIVTASMHHNDGFQVTYFHKQFPSI
jgi:hypothetical protein